MSAWVSTVRRFRRPSQKVSKYYYYAVLIDPRGRVRSQGETHRDASKAWKDAEVFFNNIPDD